MWRWEDEKMWRWEDVKMRRCEDVRMWGCEDVKMWRCEDEKMWRCEDVKMSRMWRWADVKMSRCEDEKMWRCEGCEDVRMWRWADVKMRRCEDEQMRRWEGVKWRCEDVKMFDRPPLLEEPFAQTLSGKNPASILFGLTTTPYNSPFVWPKWLRALDRVAQVWTFWTTARSSGSNSWWLTQKIPVCAGIWFDGLMLSQNHMVWWDH